jgi:hypothetical protein
MRLVAPGCGACCRVFHVKRSATPVLLLARFLLARFLLPRFQEPRPPLPPSPA